MSLTHPSLCPIYCPFPCRWASEPSWSDWRGRNSARILPPFPKELWYVPVIQVHGFLWRRVPLSSCWVGGTGRPRGPEPSLYEAADHKSRAVSVKMSALRTTASSKVYKRSNNAVNGRHTRIQASRLRGAELLQSRVLCGTHLLMQQPSGQRCGDVCPTNSNIPVPDRQQKTFIRIIHHKTCLLSLGFTFLSSWQRSLMLKCIWCSLIWTIKKELIN